MKALVIRLVQFSLLLSLSTISTADVVSVTYDGVIDDISGNQDFTNAYQTASTFHGVFNYDPTDPSQLLDNSLVVLNAANQVIMSFTSADNRELYLVNAFSGPADNIYFEEQYSTPGFSALLADATNGITAELFLDIYDATGSLLTADNHWPVDILNLGQGDYHTTLSISLIDQDTIGTLVGGIPSAVPAPSSMILLLSGLLLLRRRPRKL